MLKAGGGGGLLGALRLQPQARDAADVGPGGEGPGLDFVEVGEELQVGPGALLIGAEEITEFDELVPQGDGLQIVGSDEGAASTA
ncbi:hypothetical protein ABZ599_32955 [Streptomyces misionensis]|uniref:hypothetical protein n=1 Tax=Streptomyces misionensis TaxID=67331 RepID=UPI0033EA905D